MEISKQELLDRISKTIPDGATIVGVSAEAGEYFELDEDTLRELFILGDEYGCDLDSDYVLITP